MRNVNEHRAKLSSVAKYLPAEGLRTLHRKSEGMKDASKALIQASEYSCVSKPVDARTKLNCLLHQVWFLVPFD